MKKVIIQIIASIAACCFCISCEDLLNITPKASVSVPSYFKDESELQLYSNQFYAAVFPSGSDIYKEIGDNMIWAPLAEEVSVTRTIPQSGGKWNFSELRHINFFLENVGNCYDQAAVRKYTGIAKFFRAHFYFDKLKTFGEVPWYGKVLDSNDPELFKPRDSRDVVITNILKDIDDAIEVFKKENAMKDAYRITWFTALALKSRVCLFEGTFRKYHNLPGGEKYLQLCVEASEALMSAKGSYSLYTSGNQPYRDLFTSSEAKVVEVILAKDYDQKADLSNGVLTVFNVPGQGRAGFTKKFINSYLCSDGTRFTDKPGYEEMEFSKEILGRDPRLSQTIRTKSGLSFANCITGYQPCKYIVDANYTSSGKSFNDLPLKVGLGYYLTC